jgi:hypothetical protein
MYFIIPEILKIIFIIVIIIILIYILYRLGKWLFIHTDCFIHHRRFPNRPKLKRKHLEGYFISNYGKKKGKQLYHELKNELKKIGIK